MYIRKHFTTSRSVVTITVIALAAWGILGVTSLALAGPNQNIPVQVEFEDRADDGIKSHGGQIYSDEESKVQTFIGRNCGQFWLDTNTSGNAGAGRTLTLNFAAIATNPPAPLSSPFQPESVEIITAREDYGTTYVDLRAMAPGSSELVALRLKFYMMDEMKGGKIFWVLHFGDVLWADPDGDMGNPVTVTRLNQDQWTVESLSSDQARLEHHVNWGESIFIGYYSMPFKITITTLASLGAPPAYNTRSGLTATWGSIK